MYDEQESFEQPLAAELAALEKKLIELAPAALRVDRDQLMFAAGRASMNLATGSMRLGSKFLPLAATLATAASIVLATMLVWQRVETGRVTVLQPIETNALYPVVAQQDPWRWSGRMPSGYLGVRQVALTRGVGALEYEFPPAGGGDTDKSSPPATARQLLEELLPKSKHSSS